MSRLEGIAALLGLTQDQARQFTRQVRSHFEAAPSYAEIMYAVRHHPSGKPSVEQVVAAIKRYQAESGGLKGGRVRGSAGRSSGGRRDTGRPQPRGSGAPRGQRNPRSGPRKSG
jgi:hypothetical protein